MDEWTYCKDENPKVSGDYIVTILTHYDKEKLVRVFRYDKDFKEWMEPCEGDSSYFSTHCDVIAWKPCPEAAEVKDD